MDVDWRDLLKINKHVKLIGDCRVFAYLGFGNKYFKNNIDTQHMMKYVTVLSVVERETIKAL